MFPAPGSYSYLPPGLGKVLLELFWHRGVDVAISLGARYPESRQRARMRSKRRDSIVWGCDALCTSSALQAKTWLIFLPKGSRTSQRLLRRPKANFSFSAVREGPHGMWFLFGFWGLNTRKCSLVSGSLSLTILGEKCWNCFHVPMPFVQGWEWLRFNRLWRLQNSNQSWNLNHGYSWLQHFGWLVQFKHYSAPK